MRISHFGIPWVFGYFVIFELPETTSNSLRQLTRHILLITVDTLRADYLGCYGKRDIRTPNLDAFAAEGARFDRQLTSVSATLTSHCSLMTGCTPSVNGINWNGVTRPRRRRTAPEIAREAGYATTAITSWSGFQNQQVYGFESYHSEGGAGSEENRGDKTLRRVLEWLDQVDSGHPQLLWVHFIDPHTPDNCPEPFPKSSGKSLGDIIWNGCRIHDHLPYLILGSTQA